MTGVLSSVSPITQRRIENFRANRRGWWSMWIFLVLFVVSLFAEFVANDKPLLIRYNDSFYFPVLTAYPETEFGGDFLTEADYSSPYVAQLIDQNGWMIWPLIRYHHRTVSWDLTGPAPSRPDSTHWLGTDDQARDVIARVIYGFRISVLFDHHQCNHRRRRRCGTGLFRWLARPYPSALHRSVVRLTYFVPTHNSRQRR